MNKNFTEIIRILIAVFVICSFCVIDPSFAESYEAKFKQISCGSSQSVVLDTDGDMWKLDVSRNKLTKVMSSVAEVSCFFHYDALKKDKSLWLWGDRSNTKNNRYGQMGDGTTKTNTKPICVLRNVKTARVRSFNSAAVTTDGKLWTWGDNSSGQVGDATLLTRKSPANIMQGVSSVEIGSNFAGALKTDGSLWLWGSNAEKQINSTKTEKYTQPVKVLTGVKAFSLGDTYTMAIKADDSLWIWGTMNGSVYQNASRLTTGVSSVSAGTSFAAFIKNNGTLWIFGEYADAHYSSPTHIADNAVQVSSGYNHIGYIGEGGTLWNGIVLGSDIKLIQIELTKSPETNPVTPKAAISKQYRIPSIRSFKVKAGKGSFKASWKKATKAEEKLFSGYQLQYSKSKNFKKSVKTLKSKKRIKVKKKKKAISAVTVRKPKVKSKKVYYVRARRYGKYQGKTVYSEWTKVKRIKIK